MSSSLLLAFVSLAAVLATHIHKCEHDEVQLSCPYPTVINIVSVFYGRTVASTNGDCPGPNDQDTSCTSAVGASSKIEDICQGQTECHFYAENSLFTDPCVGIFKYVEVDYNCLGACASLPAIPNGKWNDDNVVDQRVGAHNILNCDSGFTAVPAGARLTCQSNSQWDHVVPRCDPCGSGVCASLAVIPNGRWHEVTRGEHPESDDLSRPVSYAAGASNRMTCNSGYVLVGDPILTCINAQWDYPLPRCDPLTYSSGHGGHYHRPSGDYPGSHFHPITFPSNHECSSVIQLGFRFRFFGRFFDIIKVSPNGYLTFDTSSNTASLPSGVAIPSTNFDPLPFIAYWATALDSTAPGCSYRYSTEGDDGHHQFILSIDSVPLADAPSDSGTLSCDVVLHEYDHHIEFQYQNTPLWVNGPSVIVGVQDPQGQVAEAALYNAETPVAVHESLAVILNEQNGVSGPPVGAIVGGVLGGVAFIGLVAGLVVYRRRKNNLAATSLAPNSSTV